MQIVSWQSVLTEHQSHTLLALQDLVQEPLQIVSGVEELPERQVQGWTKPDVTGLHVRYLPEKEWLREGKLILREYRDAIHLFNGLWADRRFFFLLILAQRQGIRTGLITEPYSEIATGYLSEESRVVSSFKLLLRPWLYRIAGFFMAKKFCAVFAISSKAVRQFSEIGVRAECMFPFGYFVPGMGVNKTGKIKANDGIRLVFIGSLIKRKGIPVLIEAMKLCAHKRLNISLDVFGPGDPGVWADVDNIRYKGVIPFGHAQEVIAEYDVLVLPSLHDGWGVVVNEALLQGVSAIVSDQVGAGTLVAISGAGEVISAEKPQLLAKCLEKICLNASELQDWKEAAVSFNASLAPEVAAAYMCDCLCYAEGMVSHKPENPWYEI